MIRQRAATAKTWRSAYALDDCQRERDVAPPLLPQAPGMLAEPLPQVAGPADVQQQPGGIEEPVHVMARLGTLRRQVQQRILRHGSPPIQAIKRPAKRVQ